LEASSAAREGGQKNVTDERQGRLDGGDVMEGNFQKRVSGGELGRAIQVSQVANAVPPRRLAKKYARTIN